jgi:lysyl-tRNA synthetase, class II
VTVVAERTLTPQSSNIAAYEYDPEVEDLTVEFRSGATYIYRNVPPSKYRGMQSASSVGEYFARQIRGRHNYEQV